MAKKISKKRLGREQGNEYKTDRRMRPGKVLVKAGSLKSKPGRRFAVSVSSTAITTGVATSRVIL